MVALDLTNDHKPDLPEEKKRILAAGGTVTPAGPDGRPSRMYANGHVGLAMSRSLGDGLCKDYGCIPDPEIQHFSLKLPPKAGPQGEEVDSFLIVASDGVWEFITSQVTLTLALTLALTLLTPAQALPLARAPTLTLTLTSQEACEIVSKCESASDAVENLVNEASARWRQFEGSYRDDITAIIVYLPFLDDGNEVGAPAGAAPAAASVASARSSVGGEGGKEDEDENAPLYINQGGVHGQATLARLPPTPPPHPSPPPRTPSMSPPPPPPRPAASARPAWPHACALLPGQAATGDEGIVSEHSNDFVKRRLSVVGGLVGDGGDGDSWADGED